MIISFDLDGVVCDSDWGWLDSIRRLEWPEGEEDKYYACRNKILDPYQFLALNDVGIILTGRPPHLKDLTQRWLDRNGLGDFRLVFAMEEEGNSKGNAAEFHSQAERKARYLVFRKIGVHFDDNPEVVRAMRRILPAGFYVIHVGSHVRW